MLYINAFDEYIIRAVTSLRNPLLTQIMTFITNLGYWGIFWIILGIGLSIIRKTRTIGILLLISVLLSGLINDLILKNIFSRNRPFIDLSWLTPLINKPIDYSFPSGHSFCSFACAYVVFSYNKKIGIFAYILAFLIAFSRIYLGVHYPTDVIAGMLFGTVLGYLVTKSYYIYTKKLKQNHQIKI